MVPDDEIANSEIFLDCLSATVVAGLAPSTKKAPKKRAVKGRKNEINPVEQSTTHQVAAGENDAAELSDFVQYLSEQIFLSLPDDLRALSYAAVQDDPQLAAKYSIPLDSKVCNDVVQGLPPSTTDSLLTYNLIPDSDTSTLEKHLDPILTNYITTTTAPPPEYTPAITASRPDGCEICGRGWVPLTYHHLIPRQVHGKAIKRGWHKEWELNKVAWLCRACHNLVHRIASIEELAKEYYDVELLLEREDVQKFAAWVRGVRWKAR